MQKRLRVANANYLDARADYEDAIRIAKRPPSAKPEAMSVHRPSHKPTDPHNLAFLYCQVLSRLVGVKKAEAADVRSAHLHPVAQDTVPKRAAQDTSARRDTTTKAATDSAARRDTAKKLAPDSAARAQTPQRFVPIPAPPAPPVQARPQATGAAPGTLPPPPTTTFKDPVLAKTAAESLRAMGQQQLNANEAIADAASRVVENRLRYDTSRRAKNRYEIEIHKKFALAAACFIFVVLGAPLALRFPRGGVGLVLLVSLIVFALYYVGLIGGESLANKGIVPPFWAMWGTNVVLTIVGVVLLLRMGREDSSGRGGNWGDRIDALRDWVNARRGRPTVLSEEVA
jgi:lipopolysaccharide export system permease protein